MSDHTLVSRDGAHLFVRMLEGDAAEPTVIVQHGAPGAHTHAESEAAFGFLAEDHRVVTFDARGNGSSSALGPLDHMRWAEDIEELRDWTGAARFVLAAHSYGGFIALEYALRYPGRLAGLILQDTSASGAVIHDLIEREIGGSERHIDRERLMRTLGGTLKDPLDFVAALSAFAALYVDSDASPPAAVAHPKLHFETHNAAFGTRLSGLDFVARLPQIACPTLVIVGRNDRITPPACSELMASKIPAATLVVLDGAGHTPALERPGAFRRSVRAFLSKLSI